MITKNYDKHTIKREVCAMTPTETWLKEHLQIPLGANVGDVTIPFERMVVLLETFHKYKATKAV